MFLLGPPGPRADESHCNVIMDERFKLSVINVSLAQSSSFPCIVSTPIRPSNARTLGYMMPLSLGCHLSPGFMCGSCFPSHKRYPLIPSIFPNKSSCSPLLISLTPPRTASSWPLSMQWADAHWESPWWREG